MQRLLDWYYTMPLLTVLSLHVAQFILVVLIISFSPPNSILRTTFFPVLVVLTLNILPRTLDAVSTKVQASFIATNVVGVFIQYIDVALISRWSYLSHRPLSAREKTGQINLDLAARKEKQKLNHEALWRRLKWGLFATTAWRAPATSWEVKGTPRFDSRRPTWIPSRPRFLLNTLKTLIPCWIILDLMSLVPPQSAEARVEDFAWNRVPIFSRLFEVSIEEIAKRFLTTFLFWTATYCILQVFYSIVAGVSVALGLTRVEVWPPLFGSMTQCYSMRQFWG